MGETADMGWVDGHVRLSGRRLKQLTRQLTVAWTPCEQFIHIAMAEDVMTPDWGKMVVALDACPACDIAHCGLRIIDCDSSRL